MPGLRYGLQLNVSSGLGEMTVLNVHNEKWLLC